MKNISKKICIIGKNSQIVKSILWSEKYFLISHKQLNKLNLNQYSAFVLFSWSHNSLNDNLKIFHQLKNHRVIFISTIAVYSLLLRNQWNNYPNDKSKLEKLYWKNGSSVVRIGVVSKNYRATYPYSSPENILISIETCLKSKKQALMTPIEIIKMRENISIFEKVIYRLSFLSNSKFYRIICEAVIKFSIKKYIPLYGYSADSIRILSRPIQIGYGVIGSRNPFSDSCQIFTDNRKNIILKNNGFKDTWIGRNLNGLSSVWHGVKIVKKGKNFYKSVPLFIRRKKPPFDKIPIRVKSISLKYKQISLDTNKIINPVIPYYDLFLSMGPIENSKILSKCFNMQIKLSDHMIGCVGIVSTKSLIEKKFIYKKFNFIFGRKIFSDYKEKFILDFRPHIKSNKLSLKNFYNEQTKGIIFKIINRLSFEQINQAFFNKFGFCYYQKDMDVWIQAIANNSITVKKDSVIKNRSFYNNIDDYLTKIRLSFPNILISSKLNFFDGQHITGGEKFLSKYPKKLIYKKYNIKILGIPSNTNFNAFHHSWMLISNLYQKN